MFPSPSTPAPRPALRGGESTDALPVSTPSPILGGTTPTGLEVPETNPQTAKNERICWKCGKHFGAELENCPEDGSRLLDLDPSDLEDPLVGTLFDDRFRIYHKLGEGGMGNVYSARQIDFEREVALKILKADFLRDENIRKRFMYEARAISNLRHPHALRLFDFGQAPDGSFYMVMELLEGESLADRLAYRFVTFREVFELVPPVCGVLYEAHQNKVIHRDLKPENIYIVDVNGKEEFTKLLDFGIAKHLTDRTMTQSGTLWGTPAYMSPEQARGDKIGAPADIYAVGIMLFELISGNLPFAAETQMGLAMKHINVPARPLRSVPGLEHVVPPALDDLVMACLAKDPAHRPQDCESIAEILQQIRNDYFDEALLDCVPAEEVDAIALQDWIANEPTMDDSAIPVAIHRPPAITTPPPGPYSPPPPLRDASNPSVPTLAGAPDDEDLMPPRTLPVVPIVVAVIAVLAVIAAVAIGGKDPEDPEAASAAVAEREQVVAAAAEEASDSAGASAVLAASVVVRAQAVAGLIHGEATLAADIAAGTPKEQGEPAPKQGDLKPVKKLLESTF